MAKHRYATLLRALCDDPHPENDLEEGDMIIEPGQHPDGYQYMVLAERNVAAVNFETVGVYESPTPLEERELAEYVREQYDKGEGGLADREAEP